MTNALGSNLRALIARDFDQNVSEACRALGINRTQFNRYMSGESWPSRSALDRICSTFKIDARVLTTPLASIAPSIPMQREHELIQGNTGLGKVYVMHPPGMSADALQQTLLIMLGAKSAQQAQAKGAGSSDADSNVSNREIRP